MKSVFICCWVVAGPLVDDCFANSEPIVVCFSLPSTVEVCRKTTKTQQYHYQLIIAVQKCFTQVEVGRQTKAILASSNFMIMLEAILRGLKCVCVLLFDNKVNKQLNND